MSFVIGHVLSFQLGCVRPSGISRGFLLDLEPSVDVIGEESRLALFFGKVDFEESVPPFLNFWGAPGPSERTFFVGVRTVYPHDGMEVLCGRVEVEEECPLSPYRSRRGCLGSRGWW